MSIFYCSNCHKKYAIMGDDSDMSNQEFKCHYCGYINTTTNNIDVEDDYTPEGVQTQILNVLKNIEKMFKFFYYSTIIGIVIWVLYFLIELGSNI